MERSCIERLLEIPELRVLDVRIEAREVFIDVEMAKEAVPCPKCQSPCEATGEAARVRTVRDLPILEKPVRLLLHRHRFRCAMCKERFWEQSESLGKRRWTERLMRLVREELLKGTPTKQLSRRYGVAERTLFRWVFERSHGGRGRKLGTALGIDEFATHKGHEYDTHVVDLLRSRTIVVLPGRSKDDLVKWFRSRRKEELALVKSVVTDMSSVYAAAVREVFGDGMLIIDRFHVVKLAIDALEEGARALRKELTKEEAKRMKKLRKMWLKPWRQLDFSLLMERTEWLQRFPQMQQAIEWVQDLRDWFHRRYAKPAAVALQRLAERASSLLLEPLRPVGETLKRWAGPIVHFIRNRFTNGFTEGCNTKIKLIQRMAYGLRNEHNRQLRIKAWVGAP